MVVVAVSGGAVVVVTLESTTVVDVTGSVVVVVVEAVALVAGAAKVVVGPAGLEVDVTEPGAAAEVVVVGRPIATGVSTTRSRIPATAADAINTESAVAASHARPMPKYLLIHPSMHHPTTAWVKRRLNDDETTVIHCTSAALGCNFL